MAAVADPRNDLNTPLLSTEPQFVLEIESNGSDHDDPNPFEFIGARPLSFPRPHPIDPFRNHTPSINGFYEFLKIVICIPVALVRLTLFGLSLLVGFLATKLALYGWKDKHNPMPKWRCRLMWVTRICSRCILFCFGYHWIKRVGRPASRETAPIVVCNHVSYIEPIFFFYELFPTIVASESHDAIPFVGTIIRAMQVIYVNRFSAPSRKHAVHEIKVEYLPVIAPLDNKKENAGHFAERTSFAIASALNVIQTSHSYGDLMLLTKASELRQYNASSYMVEMAWVDSTFNISTLEAMEFLDKFLAMNPNSSGRVKIHDFSRSLRLGLCPLSEKIFAFIDVEKLGSITFRQFLLGSAHIMKQPLFQQACTAAFNCCDDEGKGYITKQQLGDAIHSAMPSMNDNNVSELFNLFDSDNDGAISYDDFMACLRRNPLLVALFASNSMHCGLIEGGKLVIA
ncbi:lysophospholipid acyltransferase LPEAT2 isoform X3 [Magnolia sinica]|uniref:lysophospholipid acyltransferase LPEAT2 isoform X3 n=1 Tax=Magnolia sinica TaxID=86752 RepID=UPI0026595571|nr:lysophospholipid acyltransferase LPEAT2 isoform X3 [Magnolia sinica]